MSIKKIKLLNFRNFNELSIEIPDNGLCITGSNGLGKTSILEAIHYLLIGKSQRGALKRDIINKNSEDFYVEGSFYDSSVVSIGYSKKSNKSIIKKNGDLCKSLSDWFGNNSIVSFGPNDSDIVFGSPSDRRKYVDILLSISDDIYLKKLINYKKNLSNRNKLLINCLDSELFDIYEENVAESGSYIFNKRNEFINSIKNEFIKLNKFVINENLTSDINIKSTINVDNVDNYKELLITSLKERRNRDKILGFSTIGPQRDDINIKFNGSVSKNICSRGQGRVLSISFKISSINWINGLIKNKPIILIDDAFSELDIEKTEKIYSLIKDKGQILLTSLSKENNLDNSLKKFELK